MPRRRGRPSKTSAEDLSRTIVEIATRQFLENGFQATSMDVIAAEAGSSKRTLYSRFPSKAHLFEASITQQVELNSQEFSQFEAEHGPTEETLLQMARWLQDKMLQPNSIALFRLLAMEAHRHEELHRYSEEKIMRPIVDTLAHVFERATTRQEIADYPSAFLADQFVQAVCGREIRRRIYGRIAEDDPVDRQEERIANAVRLFLGGALAKPTMLLNERGGASAGVRSRR